MPTPSRVQKTVAARVSARTAAEIDKGSSSTSERVRHLLRKGISRIEHAQRLSDALEHLWRHGGHGMLTGPPLNKDPDDMEYSEEVNNLLEKCEAFAMACRHLDPEQGDTKEGFGVRLEDPRESAMGDPELEQQVSVDLPPTLANRLSDRRPYWGNESHATRMRTCLALGYMDMAVIWWLNGARENVLEAWNDAQEAARQVERCLLMMPKDERAEVEKVLDLLEERREDVETQDMNPVPAPDELRIY